MDESHEEPLEELLPAIGRGRESAVASFYDRTSARVFGLASMMLGSGVGAEEATLSVYGEVWKRATTFDPTRGTAVTWLMTLTRSVCLDWLRRERRQRERTTDFADMLDCCATEPGPEESSWMAEESHRLRKALWNLPANQREVVVTAYFGGLSYSQTAAALSLPEGTVKARIRSALGALRRALGPHQECVS